jgi:hypothetical protein
MAQRLIVPYDEAQKNEITANFKCETIRLAHSRFQNTLTAFDFLNPQRWMTQVCRQEFQCLVSSRPDGRIQCTVSSLEPVSYCKTHTSGLCVQFGQKLLDNRKLLDLTRIDIGLRLVLSRLPLFGPEISLALVDQFLWNENQMVSHYIQLDQIPLIDSNSAAHLDRDRHLPVSGNFGQGHFTFPPDY